MSEKQSLLSKKRQSSRSRAQIESDSDVHYGSLKKQYVVYDKSPRYLFTPTHCVIVSLVLLFTVVMIATSLIVGLPRVQDEWTKLALLRLATNHSDLLSNLQTPPTASVLSATTTISTMF